MEDEAPDRKLPLQDCGCSGPGAAGPERAPDNGADEVCCGRPPRPAAGLRERPGYRIEHFVEGFLDTGIGPVPRVRAQTDRTDRGQNLLVRLGWNRADYAVAPGLYCAGEPDGQSPVLVTANFKLTFDLLRTELQGRDLWILVLDTRAINVWCAAGKSLFSTGELVRRVQLTGLAGLVAHRELIVPQLGATGVDRRKVRSECGFDVIWGPIRSRDLPRFLDNGGEADEDMRRVDFPMADRLVLVPVEVAHLIKPLAVAACACFLLSGFGPAVFSPQQAWIRGTAALGAVAAGAAAGTVVVPALLPWLPGRSFSLKGVFAGALAALPLFWCPGWTGWLEGGALGLLVLSGASYLGMNFTGSTPFTSPSGVEKEMRRGLPLQAAGFVLGLCLWLAAPFASV